MVNKFPAPGHWVTRDLPLYPAAEWFFDVYGQLKYETIDGELQAFCLKLPSNAFIGLTAAQIDWFEMYAERLLPSTKSVLIQVFERAKKAPWGWPLKEQHMVELLKTGTVSMPWDRKLNKAAWYGNK